MRNGTRRPARAGWRRVGRAGPTDGGDTDRPSRSVRRRL